MTARTLSHAFPKSPTNLVMKTDPLVNTHIEAPKFSFTVETTPDGEFATALVIWGNGARFATASAESEPVLFAQQEAAFRLFCAAPELLAVLINADAEMRYAVAAFNSDASPTSAKKGLGEALILARSAIDNATRGLRVRKNT